MQGIKRLIIDSSVKCKEIWNHIMQLTIYIYLIIVFFTFCTIEKTIINKVSDFFHYFNTTAIV